MCVRKVPTRMFRPKYTCVLASSDRLTGSACLTLCTYNEHACTFRLLRLLPAGPKDVPVFARAAGRMVGRAMGFLFAARSRLNAYADQNQLREVRSLCEDTSRRKREQLDYGTGIRMLPVTKAQVFTLLQVVSLPPAQTSVLLVYAICVKHNSLYQARILIARESMSAYYSG